MTSKDNVFDDFVEEDPLYNKSKEQSVELITSKLITKLVSEEGIEV